MKLQNQWYLIFNPLVLKIGWQTLYFKRVRMFFFLCSLSLSLLFKLELLSDISRLWNVPLIISWTQWGVTKLEPSLKFHLKDPLREEQYAHKSLNVVFRPHGRLSGRKYFAKNERMKYLFWILLRLRFFPNLILRRNWRV